MFTHQQHWELSVVYHNHWTVVKGPILNSSGSGVVNREHKSPVRTPSEPPPPSPFPSSAGWQVVGSSCAAHVLIT